jgi:hypothetical protein
MTDEPDTPDFGDGLCFAAVAAIVLGTSFLASKALSELFRKRERAEELEI